MVPGPANLPSCWAWASPQFARVGDRVDCRKGSYQDVAQRLSEEDRQRILLTCNELEFADLAPVLILPVLTDRCLYIGS